MKNRCLVLAGAVMVLALCSPSSAKSTSAQTRPQESGIAAQAQQQAQQPSQEFQGTIEKVSTKYILEDKASGARYQLDNQDKAKQFLGEDVKVSGTLDPNTDTIAVSAIQEVK